MFALNRIMLAKGAALALGVPGRDVPVVGGLLVY